VNNVDIQTLWDTYDFTLFNIIDKEAEVSFFVEHVEKKAALVEAGANTKNDFLEFCKKHLKDHEDLSSLYCKQIHTLKDLIKIKPQKQPEEREISLDSLKELKSLTLLLKNEMDNSIKNLNAMIAQVEESEY